MQASLPVSAPALKKMRGVRGKDDGLVGLLRAMGAKLPTSSQPTCADGSKLTILQPGALENRSRRERGRQKELWTLEGKLGRGVYYGRF